MTLVLFGQILPQDQLRSFRPLCLSSLVRFTRKCQVDRPLLLLLSRNHIARRTLATSPALHPQGPSRPLLFENSGISGDIEESDDEDPNTQRRLSPVNQRPIVVEHVLGSTSVHLGGVNAVPRTEGGFALSSINLVPLCPTSSTSCIARSVYQQPLLQTPRTCNLSQQLITSIYKLG